MSQMQSQERIDRVTKALGVQPEIRETGVLWDLGVDWQSRVSLPTASTDYRAIDQILVTVGLGSVMEPLADDVAAQVARMLTVASERDQAARDRRIEAVRAACARLESGGGAA